MINIRAYNSPSDEDSVFAIYLATIGNTWPLTQQDFHEIINNQNYVEGSCFVAQEDNKIIGFIATQITAKHDSSIPIVLYYDESIGNQLIQSALEYLKNNNVSKIQLGGGGNSYFWPGIPANLPGQLKLYSDNVFVFTEKSVDLIQDLATYTTPKSIVENTSKLGLSFSVAKEVDQAKVLQFEKDNFPQWYKFYEDKVKVNGLKDILIVSDSSNTIIGTVLLSTKHSVSKANFWLWRKLIGEDSGAFGAIGVRPDMRNCGIGIALAAKATEALKNRGVRSCYIGWTWLIDWYGKLGYTVWREYMMSWKVK